MEMQPNKMYTVTKKIKIHTSPLYEAIVPLSGIFIKQTAAYLIFDGFKVRKRCVVTVEEVSE